MPLIQQPSNQIKLTNVSLVRIKKGKKRFEIACYKNKVLEWRSGIEKDLDNVLQIPNVFTNVSKGQVAPKADLQKAFGDKATTDEIVLEILNKGELQVGDKERHAQLDRVHHEVIDIVAGKLVDPRTKRVYTTGMIEKALEQLSSQSQAAQQGDKDKAEGAKAEGAKAEGATSDAAEEKPKAEDKGKGKELPKWTGVVTTKSAKSQALDAMKALIAHQPIPVARARMRLRVTCPTSILKQAVKSAPKPHGHSSGDAENADEKPQHGTVKETILGLVEQVESQDVTGDEWEVIGFVEPGAFKALTEFIGGQTKGRGRAEVLDMAVVNEDD